MTTPPFSEEQEEWLKKNNYHIQKLLGQEKGSRIWLTELSGRLYVIKAPPGNKGESLSLSKEAANLQIANGQNIGPSLVTYNILPEFIILEYVEGIPFPEWLKGNPSLAKVWELLRLLYKQVTLLDRLGIEHEGLVDPARSIWITPTHHPVILDFDRSKNEPEPTNVKRLEKSLLSGSAFTAQKVREILGDKWNARFNEMFPNEK